MIDNPSFFSTDMNDGFYYTYNCENGLVDEIQFLLCPPYESYRRNDNWKLIEKNHLVISGLRSPCPNSGYT